MHPSGGLDLQDEKLDLSHWHTGLFSYRNGWKGSKILTEHWVNFQGSYVSEFKCVLESYSIRPLVSYR